MVLSFSRQVQADDFIIKTGSQEITNIIKHFKISAITFCISKANPTGDGLCLNTDIGSGNGHINLGNDKPANER
ncbi:MAG: hypothetical protein WAqMacA_16720 [Shewanella algae]